MYTIPQTIKRFWPMLLSVGLLFGAITYFHWPGVQPGYTFLPVDLANNLSPWRTGAKTPLQNWLISDPLYQFYPFFQQRVENLRAGQPSLWTPLLYLGHPAHADPLFQSYYPLPLLFGLIWGAERGYGLALYAHILLAALATYGLLRTIRSSQAGACLGALTYALSGYLLTWFEFAFWTSTLAWLPAVLWFYQLALTHRRAALAALAGLAFGLAIVAGQFQFALVFGIGLGLYTLVYVGQKSFAQRQFILWPLSYLGLTGTIGALVAGVQLVPFLELLAHSRRLLSHGLADPLPFRQLATLFIPNFYGNPAHGDYWGASNYNEATLYPGIVALYLALTVLLARPKFWTACLGIFGLILLYWAMGGPGVNGLAAVPLLKYISLHRSLFALPLLIGILAALALDAKISWWALLGSTLILGGLIGLPFYLNWGDAAAHIETLRDDIRQAVILVGVVFVLLAVKVIAPHPRLEGNHSPLGKGTVNGQKKNFLLPNQWLPPQTGRVGVGLAVNRIINWLIVAVVFGDLVSFGRTYNPSGPVADLLPMLPSIQVLQERVKTERVMPLQRANELLFVPNLLMKFSLAEAGGYSSLMSPALHQLLTTADPTVEWWWLRRASNFVPFSYPSSRLLDLLTVCYIISPEVIFDPGPEAEIVQSGCATTSAEITTDTPLQGQFTVRHTAINRLDLPFQVAQGGLTENTLRLRMWRGAAAQELIVEKVLPVVDLRQQPNQIVYFAPEKDAPGQDYHWELAALTAGPTGVALCQSSAGTPAFSLYGSELTEIYHDDQVYLYERFAPFPRAAVVYASRLLPDEQAILPQMLDETFDLRNIALSTVAFDLPAASPLAATPAEITEYTNTKITMRANAKAPGLLVLSDLDYPGWQATVDGEPVAIQPVNFVMRGVPLPPGEHIITFAFRPNSLRLGWVFTGLGVAIALLTIVQSARRNYLADNRHTGK